MSFLVQPTSPQSRRSSSVSTLGQFNNSTLISLYTRQSSKRKTTRWRLVRKPVPVNPTYRKNLILGIFLPCVAGILFVSSTLGPHWETVHFKFEQILNLFSISNNCTREQDEVLITMNPNYTIEFIILRNGLILHRNDLPIGSHNCRHFDHNLNDIIGIVIHNQYHSKITGTLKSEIYEPLPRFSRTKYKFSPQRLASLVPELAPDLIQGDKPRNLWLLMNFNAGIWSMRYEIAGEIIR